MVELAWSWLRFQPGSQLSQWFNERFAGGGKRMRRIGIVALARRLSIALWRYLEQGEITVLTNYSIFRPQHGHRSRRASSAAASSSRSVVMESGTWRCLRRGAPGPEAFG
jgi:hypothetical protein